ncbi:hypothetical protein T440DRAFT_272122 [Plenodomus tracheiphilus IPT5]|uniref:Uncharacterized protein n=1 Tax=Plenodomus tracheiphilus IPT5 TaxID=1408161 RepID=A0A6A7BG06_9PLEO|nr:hypothetical protein T440DRAFT_272122 [Plenodomus tracheiphilus IPT5]
MPTLPITAPNMPKLGTECNDFWKRVNCTSAQDNISKDKLRPLCAACCIHAISMTNLRMINLSILYQHVGPNPAASSGRRSALSQSNETYRRIAAQASVQQRYLKAAFTSRLTRRLATSPHGRLVCPSHSHAFARQHTLFDPFRLYNGPGFDSRDGGIHDKSAPRSILELSSFFFFEKFFALEASSG